MKLKDNVQTVYQAPLADCLSLFDDQFTIKELAKAFSPGSYKIVGTLIVRTSNQLTATEQKTLENDIIHALIKL